MIEQQAAEISGSEIVVLGTLPPPVTGMTLFTERVVRTLEAAGSVRLYDWSSRMKRHGLISRLRRIGHVLGSIVQVACRGRVCNKRMYLVANSGGGLYLTAAIAFIAGRLGYSIYLHHHVYSYIDRYDWRMAWIDRCMSPRGCAHRSLSENGG